MKRTKTLIKTAIIALVFMLSIAVSFAITGAWYLATRNAKGTITLNDGIIIDYSGFDQGAGVWENNAEFSLFGNGSAMLPGASVNLNDAAIKANSSSADFFARVKLEYKFFTDLAGEYEVTNQIADYSAFINTPTFAQGWVDGRNGDGWFYYATGTTFNTLPSADYVNIFTPNQSITLNGDAAGFDHQGGGYQYDEFTLIKRIEVVLTLGTYQADLAAAANAGWEIVPLVENSNSQVVEIYSNQITLGNVGGAYKLGTGEAGSLAYDTATLGTTLKIVVAGDSQINANAFENSGLEEIYIGDQDYINGVSSYAARIYSTPSTFIIGSNAFKGCTNLTLNLASGVNYTIYTNAIPSGATVNYNGSPISLPTTAGTVSGTTITMATPNIVSGGSGAGAVNSSNNSNCGNYTYEDAAGNIWYFDLGTYTPYHYDENLQNWLSAYWNTNNTDTVEVLIRHCELANTNTLGQTLYIPESITSTELYGSVNVVAIGYDDVSQMEIFRESDKPLISSIIVPNSVKGIHDGINRLSNMTSIVLGDALVYIGHCFNQCNSLTEVTIPDSVIAIESLFYLCPNLTYVHLGNSLQVIEGQGFAYCSLLRTLTIPSTVTKINPGAIGNSDYFESFTADGIYSTLDNGRLLMKGAELVAVAANGLTSYTIPNMVESIAAYTFSHCLEITSITFEGSGRTQNLEIGNGAFSYSSNLATVNFNNWPSGVTVRVGNDVFAYCHPDLVVNIPNQD